MTASMPMRASASVGPPLPALVFMCPVEQLPPMSPLPYSSLDLAAAVASMMLCGSMVRASLCGVGPTPLLGAGGRARPTGGWARHSLAVVRTAPKIVCNALPIRMCGRSQTPPIWGESSPNESLVGVCVEEITDSRGHFYRRSPCSLVWRRSSSARSAARLLKRMHHAYVGCIRSNMFAL